MLNPNATPYINANVRDRADAGHVTNQNRQSLMFSPRASYIDADTRNEIGAANMTNQTRQSLLLNPNASPYVKADLRDQIEALKLANQNRQPSKIPNTAAFIQSSMIHLAGAGPSQSHTNMHDQNCTTRPSTPPTVGPSNGMPLVKRGFKGPSFTDTNTVTQASDEPGQDNGANLADLVPNGLRPVASESFGKLGQLELTVNPLGAIGDHRPNTTGLASSGVLMSVYQNLLAYKQDYRRSCGETLPEEGEENYLPSYWTRHWAPAAPRLCDLGPEGNNSFFGEDTGAMATQAVESTSQAQPITDTMGYLEGLGANLPRQSPLGTIGDHLSTTPRRRQN